MELTGQKEFFTGNVNEDKKMLLRIGNSNVMMEGCNSPTAIKNKYCDENFFEERVKLEFPDRYKGKSWFKSWKNYYLILLEEKEKQIKTVQLPKDKEKAQDYLLNLPDRNLLEICVENPKDTYLKSVCNEDFWKKRYEKYFEKEFGKINNPIVINTYFKQGKIEMIEKPTTWRNQYLHILQYTPEQKKILNFFRLTGIEKKDIDYIYNNYDFKEFDKLCEYSEKFEYFSTLCFIFENIKNPSAESKFFQNTMKKWGWKNIVDIPKGLNIRNYVKILSEIRSEGLNLVDRNKPWEKITDEKVWKYLVVERYQRVNPPEKGVTWKDYYMDLFLESNS